MDYPGGYSALLSIKNKRRSKGGMTLVKRKKEDESKKRDARPIYRGEACITKR